VPQRLALLALATAAAGIAAGLWLAAGGGGKHEPTRSEYLARVSSICRGYARQLARIGAPSEVAAYGEVESLVGRVLPLLRRQSTAMQAVRAPVVLRPRLDRLFALSRRSVGELEATLAAARRHDAGAVGSGLVRFAAVRDEAHALATVIGVRCEAK
jgi:hypothetical protein